MQRSNRGTARAGFVVGLVAANVGVTLFVGPRVAGADGGYVHRVITKDGVTRFGLR